MVKWGQLARRTHEEQDTTLADEGESTPSQQRTSDSPVGQMLREIREEKGLTLEEIERATRIKQKFLTALEEGNYEALPTPGHIHGFLRNYAGYLGLDWDEVESLYTKERSGHRLFEPKIFHPKNIALGSQGPVLKADLVLGLVVALVAVVVGGWAFWQYVWPLIQPAPAPSPTAAATAERVVNEPSATATRRSLSSTSTPTPSATPSATSSPVPPTATLTAEPTPTATHNPPPNTATPTQPPALTPTSVPTRADSVVLQIKVTERAWLQITVDGQELPGELFQAGAEKEWQGKTSIYFICGNAGGVEVTVNGEELGTLGERGQVIERTWTPEGEVTPTPGAESTPGTSTPTPGATSTP